MVAKNAGGRASCESEANDKSRHLPRVTTPRLFSSELLRLITKRLTSGITRRPATLLYMKSCVSAVGFMPLLAASVT
jgi:hypothetical protein